MNVYYKKTQSILNEISSETIDDDIFKFIANGVLKFIKSLNIKNIDENFEVLVNEANDFYETYLMSNEDFLIFSIEEKSLIIYQFFKNELPQWISNDIDLIIDREYNTHKEFEPYDINAIDIINNTFDVMTLYKKYKMQEIELSPNYQRNFVWTSKQKSRLIESILIKIPLPIFYIDARDEDKWVVVDGLQRLSTIFTFMDNDFRLSNLEFLTNLNGKKNNELERKYQRRIEDFQLICSLIRPGTPSNVAFSIFQRINTLGSVRGVQEIRNAMYIGKSTTLLIELSRSKEFIDIVTESKIKGLSKRMEDNAIILRYLAFKIFSYNEYDNNMNTFLENTMDKLNQMRDIEVQAYKENFKLCMQKASVLFSEFDYTAFSKAPRNSRQNPISKVLFESIGYSLDKYKIEDIEENKQELANRLKEVYQDKEFIFKTSIATNNPSNVKYRFETIENLFKDVIGY